LLQHCLERLRTVAIIDAHARSVLPDELVTLDAVDEIRLGFDEPASAFPSGSSLYAGPSFPAQKTASKTMRGHK
jgi:hypothetical protein